MPKFLFSILVLLVTSTAFAYPIIPVPEYGIGGEIMVRGEVYARMEAPTGADYARYENGKYSNDLGDRSHVADPLRFKLLQDLEMNMVRTFRESVLTKARDTISYPNSAVPVLRFGAGDIIATNQTADFVVESAKINFGYTIKVRLQLIRMKGGATKSVELKFHGHVWGRQNVIEDLMLIEIAGHPAGDVTSNAKLILENLKVDVEPCEAQLTAKTE